MVLLSFRHFILFYFFIFPLGGIAAFWRVDPINYEKIFTQIRTLSYGHYPNKRDTNIYGFFLESIYIVLFKTPISILKILVITIL